MTSMKVVPIPVIENFANLIVYPSEQEVSNKQKNKIPTYIFTFREKAHYISSIGGPSSPKVLREVCKLSFCLTMSTACFLPLALPLGLSQCTP